MLAIWSSFKIHILIACSFMGSVAIAVEPDLRAIEETSKVSLLIASAQGATRSSFGHAYLRFSNANDRKKDFVIELVADESEEAFSGWNSILRGIGLSAKANYKTMLVVSNFDNVKYELTVVKNRSLTTLPLLLSPLQLSELKRYLIENQDDLKKEDYLFFSKNCASKLSEAIDLSLGHKRASMYSNVPILLEKKYEHIINWTEKEVEPSAQELRKEIADKLLPKNLRYNDNPLLSDLYSQLVNPSYSIRAYAIIKLLHLKQIDPHIDNQTLRQARAYLLSTTITEETHNAKDIINQIKTSGSEILLVPLYKAGLEYPMYSVSDKNDVSIESSVFVYETNKLMIRYTYSFEIDSASKTISVRSIDIPASDFGFHIAKNVIYFSDQDGRQFRVGFLFQSKLFGVNAILSDVIFRADISNKSKWFSLLPIAMINTESNLALSPKSTLKFSPHDAIAMKNFNSNINLGNCASLVALQHILFEQTFFVPDRPRLSPEENIVLLKSAMSGKFIIIPGYTNTRDWFASLDEATTKDIVSNLSYEINIKNYSQLMKQYFSRIAIDIQNLQDLKHSLEMGMIVPVRFKVDGTREEHIFLITEIIERDSFFELGVYDSNLGGHLPAGSMKIKDVDRFKIDKRTGLFTQKDYTAGAQLFVDQQVFERRSGFIQAKLHPNMAKFALEAIDKQSFAFSLNELSVNGLQ